jgi:hypothetical protein
MHLTWHQVDDQTWTTQFRGQLLQISYDGEAYNIADVTDGYNFIAVKGRFKHAKTVANTYLSRIFQEEEVVA